MEIKLSGKSSDSIQVDENIFNCSYNEPLIHQVVTAYLANSRAGTQAQKTRSQVRGGGAKPWKQKGTGRARAGTIRSPLWRGGGVTFAAHNRDYAQKINKKMYKKALRAILSELVRQKRLQIVAHIECENPKTRELMNHLVTLNLKHVLIVVEDVNQNLYLSARNIPTVQITSAGEVDPVNLLNYPTILMTVEALKKIEERLA